MLHVGERGHGIGDPLGDLGPERAPGDGERHGDPDPIALHRDPPHHVEIHDRLANFGIFDRSEGVEHLGLGGH